MRARSIAQVLDASPELGRFMPLVDRLVALRAAVRDAMPRELADAAAVVALKDDVVSILADNSAAAAKLRMLEPMLVRACRKAAPQVAVVRVRVQAGMAPRRRTAGKRARLNAPGAAVLAQLAEALPPSPLRDAVARLSRKGPGDDPEP
jgi:hypothetical protein